LSLVEPAEGPRIALLVRWPDEGGAELVDHYTLERDGSFYFSVPQPGTYSISAFHDRNGNLVYEPDEPARPTRGETRFTVVAGQTVTGIDIALGPDDRAFAEGPVDIAALHARGASDQLVLTLRDLTVYGEVADLGEERFGPQSGPYGLWEPYSFVLKGWAGVYFLEPYDPKRVPVLFVHGISGYPREFAYLIEQLDRERFQPWVYFYPSGAYLQKVAEHLRQVAIELRAAHRFERLFVVAHSMGGLVSREFVLGFHEATGRRTIPLFVTLATPWGGHAAAQQGVDHSPVVVYSWNDVAPGSEYLRRLFWTDSVGAMRRQLPDHTSYHLLFGYDNGGAGPSGDKVVSVASQLRVEAWDEAASQRGFDTDHGGILRDPQAAAALNAILASAE
jgi:pimeloyl-ACP methyl ester carboxylesterase